MCIRDSLGLLRFEQADLAELIVRYLRCAHSDQAERRAVPELLQQTAGVLVKHRGGIRGAVKRRLVGLYVKVPVLDFHTDTVTDHVICAEPRSYSLPEGQEHGERRIEVIHIAGQRGACLLYTSRCV